MNNGQLLYRSILAEPADDTPRLAYADWLDESDEPAAHARARFIREQIASHRRGDPDTPEVKGLFTTWWREWFGQLLGDDPDAFNPSVADQYRHPAVLTYGPLIGSTERWTANARPNNEPLFAHLGCIDYYCWWLVQRGFLSVVRAHWSHWQSFGDKLCRHQPVIEVILSTRPECPQPGELEAAYRVRWPSVRTWNTSPDDFRFWTERPAWAEDLT